MRVQPHSPEMAATVQTSTTIVGGPMSGKTPTTDQFDERQVEAVARDVLQDKVYVEASTRNKNDMTQSGFTHHLIVVAAEFGARRCIDALDLPAIIHAAKLEGAAMMMEAAAWACYQMTSPFDEHSQAPEDCAYGDAIDNCENTIRTLDPATIIAKEKP